ncbi:MAG: hypothetical protein OEU57_00065 [Desulfuromonadales bacterium]|jgi:hypothetical protein|nr:hypothetical protein [Desulfuromonadales bacterium]MDH4023792.1 hypothetical protein [Desulfuromonadales bacterium]
METDWSKVIEVFSSGIIGVFLVMFLLQVLTQLSTRVIDAVENRCKGADADQPVAPSQD